MKHILLIHLLLSSCLTFASARPITNNLRKKTKKLKLDEPCLAVLEIIDYEPSSGKHEDTSLFCETPSGKFYKVPVSNEWLQGKRDNKELKSGVTGLNFVPNTMVDEETGEIELGTTAPGLINTAGVRRLAVTTTGNKTILAVRVVTLDDQLADFDEASLNEEVFSTSDTNLKTQFSACSFGQLEFKEAAPKGGASVSIANGVVTVSVNKNAAAGHAAIRNAATDALKAEFDVQSPSELADHVMYCLPQASMSGIAYGYLNSWLTVYQNNWCMYVSAQMHELGHNLNLEHSNDFKFLTSSGTSTEYDDKVGMMGFSYSNNDAPQMCFNPVKSWQLGWYSLKEETYTPTCGPVTMTVGSIVDYDDDQVDTVLLRVLQPNNGTFHYYMSYNAKVDFNSATQEAGNRLVINRGNGDDVSKSTLEGILNVNQELLIDNFDGIAGDTMSIKYDSISGRVVTVTLKWTPSDLSLCSSPDPTSGPTSVPASVATSAPTSGPTSGPTSAPTGDPTSGPTSPTSAPTGHPTSGPTSGPTSAPTGHPTAGPTSGPTSAPTGDPTSGPTSGPTLAPTTSGPNLTKTFTFKGDGQCKGVNGLMYNEASARQISSAEECAALCLAVDDTDLRGYQWHSKRCGCLYDINSMVITTCDSAYFDSCEGGMAGTGLVTSTTGKKPLNCYSYD